MLTPQSDLPPVPFGPPPARIPSLDGLRAVAISIVVASHFTKINAIPGGFGVTLFFVISGFLITHLLLREFDRTGSIDLLAFYRRRFFRLMPAIVTTLMVVALIEGHVHRLHLRFSSKHASTARYSIGRSTSAASVEVALVGDPDEMNENMLLLRATRPGYIAA